MSDHKPVSPLFRTKPMAQILEEAKTHEGGLKRVLTAFDLTAIGVGAIIGAGIFVLTGTAAADHAGPGVMLSYFFAGLSCIIAALCYAEFASRLPISGSAYTYSYASVGELFAWIIGWDLVLEYTIGSSTVAVGWTKYLVAFLTAHLGNLLDERAGNVGVFVARHQKHGFRVMWCNVIGTLKRGQRPGVVAAQQIILPHPEFGVPDYANARVRLR